jgi:predicted Na+-dependent transporter
MIGILLCAQLLPLCVGLWIRKNHTVFAEFITKPAKLLSVTLNLLTVALIFWAQFQMLKDIRLKGCLGMLCLLFAGLAVGRLMGGSDPADAKGMVLTTSARNVGVSLVVATGSFPGTAAITSTTAYAIVQTIAVGLIALAWGRLTPTIHLIRQKAA